MEFHFSRKAFYFLLLQEQDILSLEKEKGQENNEVRCLCLFYLRVNEVRSGFKILLFFKSSFEDKYIDWKFMVSYQNIY